MLHLVLVEPRIAGNVGSTIRLAAGTGAVLHLVEPLGFTMDEPRLRRAGLDYHDLATVVLHPDFEALLRALPSARLVAFTTSGQVRYDQVDWRDGDALVLGPEPTGLPAEVLDHPRIALRARIPMLPGRRSMNLSNAASVATYEAWRRLGFPQGV
jgi:tRNA (cytidine/uridine-2'-O-)-methyltransferase